MDELRRVRKKETTEMVVVLWSRCKDGGSGGCTKSLAGEIGGVVDGR